MNRIQNLDITTGLVGHWPLQTVSGTTTPDTSGSNLTGNIVNATYIPVSGSGFNIDHAISFNGTISQYIDIIETGYTRPTNVVTVSCLAYANWPTIPTTTIQAIISKKQVGGYAIEFNKYFTGIGFTVRRNSIYSPNAYALLGLISSGWHLFSGSYDGRYTTFYVDGILKGTDDAGGNYPIDYATPNNCLLIGADASGTCAPEEEGFLGYVADGRVYNRALSGPDHLELYNSLRACILPNPGFSVS